MLRKLNKKKKGQNTAEYAILISLVVAAVIAMQTYVQRGLQARMRDSVADYMVTQTAGLGSSIQYEPYYMESAFNVERNSESTFEMSNAVDSVGNYGNSYVTRQDSGYQSSSYDTTLNGLVNGI